MPAKPKLISEYHIFLSSPGDMDEERKHIRSVIDEYNRMHASRVNTRFTIIDWENYSNVGVGRPQELINDQTLEKYKHSLVLVVCLMGQRFGSPTGKYESGTEEEFNWALNRRKSNGVPEIKWYFRKNTTFQSPPDLSKIEAALAQFKKVSDFRKKLMTGKSKGKSLFLEVEPELFRDATRNDLINWLSDEGRQWNKNKKKMRNLNRTIRKNLKQP